MWEDICLKKTTICNLIPRFYDVTKGCISIDGQDISKVTLKSLEKLAKGRTIITIAHRLTTVQNADRIKVLIICYQKIYYGNR